MNITKELYIVDWSLGPNSKMSALQYRGLSMGLWYTPDGYPQTSWWKIGAAMGGLDWHSSTTINVNNDTRVSLRCPPHALLVGSISINMTYQKNVSHCL